MSELQNVICHSRKEDIILFIRCPYRQYIVKQSRSTEGCSKLKSPATRKVQVQKSDRTGCTDE